MPRLAPLVAGASLLLWVPLAAQTGLSSGPSSIALSATHPSSVGVTLPGAVTPGVSLSLVAGSTGRLALTSSWNVDPAQPVTVRFAFVEGSAASLEIALAGADSRGSAGPVAVGGPMPPLPATQEQPQLSGEELRLVTGAMAPLVGRGARTDQVQVRTGGTLTVVAITQ